MGLYIKNSISFIASQNINMDLHFVENMWIEIENKNKKIYVGVVYRHSASSPEHTELFQTL